MKTAEAIRELESHQNRILLQIETARPLVDLPPAQAQHPLATARWKMVRLLHAYQIFKHREIFDPAVKSGSIHHARVAGLLKAECIEAGESFRRHVQKWSATDIAGEWDSYRPAMLAMTDRLRGHITRERRSVQALLDAADKVREEAGARLAPSGRDG